MKSMELTAALLALVMSGTIAAAQTTATPAAATEAGAPADAATAADVTEDDDDEDDDAGNAAVSAEKTAVEHHDYGPSGIMTRSNREDLAPLTLASGQPVAEGEYQLQSGGYYRIDIVADGSAELALSGGDFFRAIWINEIVVEDIEIRPMGVHSIEFDAGGTATMSFIAIIPGRYTLSIPGSTGETQQAVFMIR